MKTMQTKELIIWDFDGVIIDSHAVIRKTYNTACLEALGEGNFPPFEEFAQHIGAILPKILEKLNLPVEKLEPVYMKYAFQFQSEIEPFEKVKNIIVNLNKQGAKMALVTGRYRTIMEKLLDRLDLNSYFYQVIAGTDVKNAKPDPEGILKVLADQKTSKEKAVYIGDAPNDILAAKAAGVEVIAVTWGMTKKEDLMALSPDYCLDTEEELAKILLSM